MIKIKGRTIFCDVDDTIQMWDSIREHPADFVERVYERCYVPSLTDSSTILSFKPIMSNINELKKLKGQGFTIVVWSAGGEDWAEAVVEAVGLKDYVSLVIAKPQAYYDDLPCEEFMGKRRFKSE